MNPPQNSFTKENSINNKSVKKGEEGSVSVKFIQQNKSKLEESSLKAQNDNQQTNINNNSINNIQQQEQKEIYNKVLEEENPNDITRSEISNFEIPKFSEKDLAIGKASPEAIIAYLNDKVRFLEAENKVLRDEVINNHSFTEKEKINYYLRLRKELIQENEKLVSEKKVREMNFKSTVDRLNIDVKDLQEKLRVAKMCPEEKNLNILSFDKSFLNASQTQNQQNVINVNKNNESFTAHTKFFQNLDKEIKQEEEKDKGQLAKLLKEQRERQVGPKNSIYNLNKKDHNNPFIPVIDDLEERVKLLEQTIREKEADIMELNEVISTNEQIATRAQAALQMEINKWKEKYLLILATRKTISQEFSELNAKTTENIKNSMSKTTYDMESKILHLEKMNQKLNDDMKAIVGADHDIDHQKVTQINNLKRDLKNLMENYDDLYHNYEESLKILTKQIDSIKQLYLTRENEFINITNYYIDTINDFSKPVTDIVANPSNLKLLEESLIAQNKQTEEMRRVAEKHIKENSMIKSENFESKAIMRQKINDAMRFYDESIANISDNHHSIEEKLCKITAFMEVFDQKFILFNSLIEDKKNLTDKVNELEAKIRMLSNDDTYKEVLSLREGNYKLSKELESKVQLLKEMEEIQEAMFNYQTENHLKTKQHHGKAQEHIQGTSFVSKLVGSINKNLESPNKKSIMRAKEVSYDTVMKMKAEIAILNSKTIELGRSKEEIENFYQEELKKLLVNIEEKNEIIDELKSIITKNENEHSSKKETIFNLWMIEFKEFKENLISISDIKNIIEKFKIEGNELKIQRDKLVSEEIYLLRQEIKTKDKSILDLKSNYKSENKNLNDMIEAYKKGIESRLSSLDNLISIKTNEVNALKNEKKRLSVIEQRKKEVSVCFILNLYIYYLFKVN